MAIKKKMVLAKVKQRKNGKKGPFFLSAFGRTYKMVPGKKKEIPFKVLREFGQYFDGWEEITIEHNVITKPKKHKNEKTVEKETKTKPKIISKDVKNMSYLEMKSTVSDMGINTHGMKKKDLIKILKEK